MTSPGRKANYTYPTNIKNTERDFFFKSYPEIKKKKTFTYTKY